MPDEKDRLGDKLHDLERAREDVYFQQRDQALIKKQQQARAGETPSALREAAPMRCPKCSESLRRRGLHNVTVDECPACGGIWLDKGEFEALAKREQEGWFSRLLRARSG